MSTVGLLLLGGEGSRCQTEAPKQFTVVRGKPLYQWALDTMITSGLFDRLILVCHSKWLEQVQSWHQGSSLCIVSGGVTRQQSSFRGLAACPPTSQWVVIHDAARPFASAHLFENVLTAAQQYGAANCVIPVYDTLVYVPSSGNVQYPLRKHFFRAQTPQGFAFSLITRAHSWAIEKGYEASDDCSLVHAMGEYVHLVNGEEDNHKITTPYDWNFFNQENKTLHPW